MCRRIKNFSHSLVAFNFETDHRMQIARNLSHIPVETVHTCTHTEFPDYSHQNILYSFFFLQTKNKNIFQQNYSSQHARYCISHTK